MAKAGKRAVTGRKRAGVGSEPGKFRPGEYVRVVPLHHPKPVASIDAVARARRADREGDLFDGRPHALLAPVHMRYSGGPLLTNVEVFTIFWGKSWRTKSARAVMNGLNKFFGAILVSPLIDQLAEYGVPGQPIGHGRFVGTKIITAQAPVGSVTDSVIRTRLESWLAAGTVPKNGRNTLYFVYLAPGIVSIMGGSKSCQNYCGYHDHVGAVYYAVMPYPSCPGCLGGLPGFDALTGTSSHELCEAITDPVPGSGWYDDINGEIGDVCAWTFKKVAGYTVQLEWSNARDRCV